jgi:hypothetical protein
MGVEEMNGLLSTLGVTANVDVTYSKVSKKVPVYEKEDTIISTGKDKNGNDTQTVRSVTRITGYEPVEEMVPIARITSGGKLEEPTVTYSGRGSVASSSVSKGSGGSKKPGKKTDIVKRYKEQDDALDKRGKEREKLEAKTDLLTGEARRKNVEAIIALREQENEVLKVKYNLAK